MGRFLLVVYVLLLVLHSHQHREESSTTSVVNLHALPRSQQILLGLGAVVTVAVVLVAAEYASELAASLTQRHFTISAPSKVRAGETVTVRWGIPDASGRPQPPSPQDRQRFPQEKIEFVYGKGKAVTVLNRTPNDGSEKVVIPFSIPNGTSGFFRVTAVDLKGRVTLVRTQSAKPTIVTVPAGSVAESPGGGGGGGGGSQAQTVALTRVCVDPTPFSAYAGWQGRHFALQFRIVGDEWGSLPSWPGESFPLGHSLENIHDHTTFILNGQVGRSLQPNQDFELRVLAAERQESPVYRFNSGPAPRLEQEQLTPCEFRVLL